MERKVLPAVSLKAGPEGVAVARFGTWDVPDADGDVLVRGSVGEQQVRISSFGHGSWDGGLPVGTGSTDEGPEGPEATLHFFMDVPAARDHFNVLRGLGRLAQWSMGFTVPQGGAVEPTAQQKAAGAKRVLKRVEIAEISPVMLGSQPGTETLYLRCDGCAAKAAGALGADVRVGLIVKGRQALDAAERFLRGEAPGPGSPGYVAQPDREAEALAAFAVHAGHAVLGYPGRTESPGIAWLKDGRLAGAYRPGAHHVKLALGLRGRRLVEVALHEIQHLDQHARGRPFDEFEADIFAKTWAGAVEAAWRMSDHGRRHVIHKKTGPPWPDDVARAGVILHAGWSYDYRPFSSGSAWSGQR